MSTERERCNVTSYLSAEVFALNLQPQLESQETLSRIEPIWRMSEENCITSHLESDTFHKYNSTEVAAIFHNQNSSLETGNRREEMPSESSNGYKVCEKRVESGSSNWGKDCMKVPSVSDYKSLDGCFEATLETAPCPVLKLVDTVDGCFEGTPYRIGKTPCNCYNKDCMKDFTCGCYEAPTDEETSHCNNKDCMQDCKCGQLCMKVISATKSASVDQSESSNVDCTKDVVGDHKIPLENARAFKEFKKVPPDGTNGGLEEHRVVPDMVPNHIIVHEAVTNYKENRSAGNEAPTKLQICKDCTHTTNEECIKELHKPQYYPDDPKLLHNHICFAEEASVAANTCIHDHKISYDQAVMNLSNGQTAMFQHSDQEVKGFNQNKGVNCHKSEECANIRGHSKEELTCLYDDDHKNASNNTDETFTCLDLEGRSCRKTTLSEISHPKLEDFHEQNEDFKISHPKRDYFHEEEDDKTSQRKQEDFHEMQENHKSSKRKLEDVHVHQEDHKAACMLQKENCNTHEDDFCHTLTKNTILHGEQLQDLPPVDSPHRKPKLIPPLNLHLEPCYDEQTDCNGYKTDINRNTIKILKHADELDLFSDELEEFCIKSSREIQASDITEEIVSHALNTITPECYYGEGLTIVGSFLQVPDENDNSEPRVRRCSSLKTGKTPPGTPGRKKIVRFADVLGLDLADVRTFLDEIPKIPTSAYNDLSSEFYSNPISKHQRILLGLFRQPGGQPNFLERVTINQVMLENAILEDPISFSIRGFIRVRNLHYDKAVHVRYSLDSWKTYSDLQATYVDNSCDGFTDKFSFLLYAYSLSIGQKIEFAIRFQSKGVHFWDNNGGVNYCFQCLPASDPSTYAPITSGVDDQIATFYYMEKSKGDDSATDPNESDAELTSTAVQEYIMKSLQRNAKLQPNHISKGEMYTILIVLFLSIVFLYIKMR